MEWKYVVDYEPVNGKLISSEFRNGSIENIS